VVLRGELTATEDLLVEGQFDGTIKVDDHSLTVGPEAQVKAEIRARQVVVLGTVTGNVSAREKIEIRKTGSVKGDLVTAGIAIDDGAYFKGSIEIVSEPSAKATLGVPSSGDNSASTKKGEGARVRSLGSDSSLYQNPTSISEITETLKPAKEA